MLLGLRSGPGQRSLVSGSGSTIDAITYIHQQFCILHIYPDVLLYLILHYV